MNKFTLPVPEVDVVDEELRAWFAREQQVTDEARRVREWARREAEHARRIRARRSLINRLAKFLSF